MHSRMRPKRHTSIVMAVATHGTRAAADDADEDADDIDVASLPMGDVPVREDRQLVTFLKKTR